LDKPKKKYIHIGRRVECVYDLGSHTYAPSASAFVAHGAVLYDDKESAMYGKLIYELSKGKKLSNFRGSKYYEYYVKRLKNEHPEYLI